MIYTDNTKKAMMLAYIQHEGQFDKSGLPYIFHPYHLAEQMGDDEDAICIALLHDVIEDTDITIEELREYGFAENIIEAINDMTHKDEEDYLTTYIQRIKKNPLARKVKLADLAHNSDPARLPEPATEAERQWNEVRMLKYKTAREILLEG